VFVIDAQAVDIGIGFHFLALKARSR
jgi:hypothetical protein